MNKDSSERRKIKVYFHLLSLGSGCGAVGRDSNPVTGNFIYYLSTFL